jgi:ferredoxin
VIIKVDDVMAFLRSSVLAESDLFQEVILPLRLKEGNTAVSFLSRLGASDSYSLDGYRAVDPVKVLFYGAREQVYPVAAKPVHRLIAGIKACDLKALKLLDRALINQDFVDPAYKVWRDSTTILSADCTEAGPACHCTLVGGKPFPEDGFDLNLSRIDDSYVLTSGSGKGRELLEVIRCTAKVSDADARTQKAVLEARAKMTELVESRNSDFRRSEEYTSLREGDMSLWGEESRRCVGCGACTNICPTCYCLILNEEGGTGSFIKVRSYDSCQWQGYARVAGGASPRPRMRQRFRNRYLCKFLYMPSNFKTLGCTGCGRCTEACPGQIDFRTVVRDVLEPPPPLPGNPSGPNAQERREV